jgi:hypothetical protein
MRVLRILLFTLLVAVVAPSKSLDATEVKSAEHHSYTWLMYCPATGCLGVMMFHSEEVSVVAEYGYVDVDWSGSWGARGGCPECEYEAGPFPGPAPEPVEEGNEDQCGDGDLNQLIREYSTYSVDLQVHCGTFQPVVPHRFAFAGATHGPWAIVDPVLSFAVGWIQEHRLYEVRVTGGYRCPHYNASLPNSASQSRHMYGKALDMTPPEDRWPSRTEYDLLRATTRDTGPRWMSDWDDYADHHLHADWA